MTVLSNTHFSHHFSSCTKPTISLRQASVLFDGVFSEPRLQHPEGVAVGPDGWVWCSSENGQILRISTDGQNIEDVASTGGFTLGLAFDGDRALFACDHKHAAIFRLDLKSRQLKRFSTPGIRIPNYPAVDRRFNRLLVSDSYDSEIAGPGIWSYDLDSGNGKIWYDSALHFANGIALSVDQQSLFVCETFARRIIRIPILANGDAGKSVGFANDLPGLPDGIALDAIGNVFVGCYEPSRILRISANGNRTDIYVDDPTAHIFCHPTNIAFSGSTLYSANLGRWHLTKLETNTHAPPLFSNTLTPPPL